jgi:hypothetical protein
LVASADRDPVESWPVGGGVVTVTGVTGVVGVVFVLDVGVTGTVPGVAGSGAAALVPKPASIGAMKYS